MAGPSCLFSSAPLSVLAPSSSHSATFLGKEALISTGSGRRVPEKDTVWPGLAPKLSPEPVTEALGMRYFVTLPGPHACLWGQSHPELGISTESVLKLAELYRAWPWGLGCLESWLDLLLAVLLLSLWLQFPHL